MLVNTMSVKLSVLCTCYSLCVVVAVAVLVGATVVRSSSTIRIQCS